MNGVYQIGFNGSVNIGLDSDYYQYVQCFQHHLEPPSRNKYTYSFAIDPRNPTPTGYLNFATMDSSKIIMELIMNTSAKKSYRMHLYYLGYKFLRYENGFVSSVFS